MRYKLPLTLIVLLAGALVWLTSARRPETVIEVAARSQGSPVARTPANRAASNLPNPEPELDAGGNSSAAAPAVAVAAKPGRTVLAAGAVLPSGPEVGPGLSPRVVLENMRGVFRQYSSRFGGNPVGTNLEITRALNGRNPGQVVFVQAEDGLRINGKGELVDNWGTPFFFHQLSGTEMEIHSAGPDRKMWTADDLVIR